MRRIKKALWVLVALAFLLEAWLWERLAPLLAWAAGLAPWVRMRVRIVAALERLPPWAALLLFAVPFLIVEPMKLVALWILAQGRITAAIVTFAVAQLAAAGVSVFLFDALRPKLMSIGWFAMLWGQVIRLHVWALEQTRPLRQALGEIMARLRGDSDGFLLRFQRRLRLLRQRINPRR